jgi:hypothetical protein
MPTLTPNPLSKWHLPAIRKWTLGGRRSADESGLTPVWTMKNNNKSGEFWNGTKTSLLGTREI